MSEPTDHDRRDLTAKVDDIGLISPALQRHLAGTAPMLRNATIGTREWALVALASLIALGDAPDQLLTTTTSRGASVALATADACLPPYGPLAEAVVGGACAAARSRCARWRDLIQRTNIRTDA